VLWLKEGDKCTKFFLRMVNSNGRNNSIESLVVNDSVSTNHAEIREHIVQFYDNLYIEQFSWQSKLDDLSFDSIGEVEANWLEWAFDKDKVFEVLGP
jgi:hypothetical protein